MSVQHTQRFALADTVGDESITITENADGTFDVETNFAEHIERAGLIDLFERFLEAYNPRPAPLPTPTPMPLVYPPGVRGPGIGVTYSSASGLTHDGGPQQ